MARMVPVGMDFWASRRSPDRLDPAMIPVGRRAVQIEARAIEERTHIGLGSLVPHWYHPGSCAIFWSLIPPSLPLGLNNYLLLRRQGGPLVLSLNLMPTHSQALASLPKLPLTCD